MELRRKLFVVLALMATVPLLFLLFGVVGRAERDLEARVESELHAALGMMERELKTLMATQKSLARGLSRVPAVEEFVRGLRAEDPAAYRRRAAALGGFFLDYQSNVPSIQALRLVDPEGRVLVKVKEGKLVPADKVDARARPLVENIAYKSFFRRALRSDQPVAVSNFERGKVADAVDFCPAMVRYSVPIRGGAGEVGALLVVNMWGRRVDDTVEASLGGYGGKGYIVEVNDGTAARDGIYLYHRNADYRFANQLGTSYRFSTEISPARWRALRNAATHGTLQTDDGRILFYRPFAPYEARDSRWLLLIESSREAILAPVQQLRHSIWLLLALVLLASLLLARWAAVRLARPVHELAQLITRYADGDHRVRYPGHRRDEIGVAGRAFNYMATSLEAAERERDRAEQAARQSERLAAIGEMAAGIGHEINNPLMNMMSLAALVEQSLDPEDEQAKRDLHVLQEEGRRCARIVQGILNFARENEPAYRDLDLAELIDETAGLMKHRLKASAVDLELKVERPLSMEGDPSQLQQVLVNLLLNALHASPPGSKIEVRAGWAGTGVELRVVDSGTGIREADLPKVFNPFFTTKPEGSGTGLGLSVSYGIVRQHGGSLQLDNRPEGGVVVTVKLPAEGSEHANEVRHVG